MRAGLGHAAAAGELLAGKLLARVRRAGEGGCRRLSLPRVGRSRLPWGLRRRAGELTRELARPRLLAAGMRARLALPVLLPGVVAGVMAGVVAGTGHPSLADVHPRAEYAVQPDGGVGIAIAPPAPP
jgi:hypothetical protein